MSVHDFYVISPYLAMAGAAVFVILLDLVLPERSKGLLPYFAFAALAGPYVMTLIQFYGLGGYMGPDLTNVVSSKGAAYARAFLISGTERMPNFGFNDEEMDDLVAFLEFVDTMGTYEAPSYQLSWYGTVVALNE